MSETLSSDIQSEHAAAPDAQLLARMIRAARTARGMTLADLATATALDKSYLSRVERNLKAPSIATVLKIAKALDVPVSQLFGEVIDDGAIHVTRTSDRAERAVRGENDYRIETLTQGKGSEGIEGFLLFPTDTFVDDLRAEHDGEELLFVVEGSVEVKFADRTILLAAGDSVQFPGSLAHQIRRVGKKAHVLVAVSRR